MKRIPILTDWFKSIHRNFFCEDIQIADGNEGEGKVLTSDANGQGTWQEPTGSMPVGTTNQILRHNGTIWGVSSRASIVENTLYTDIGIINGSPYTTLYGGTHFRVGDSYAYLRMDCGAAMQSLQIMLNGEAPFMTYHRANNLKFAVKIDGQIFSAGLAGAGSALLQTDSYGNITRNTAPVMQRKTRLVTSAELLALHSTPLILIGQQAGKVIRLHRVGYVYTHGMAYGSSGSGLINVAYDGVAPFFGPMFTVIAQSSSQFQDAPYVTPGNPGFQLSELINKNILMIIPDGFALLTGTGTIKVIIDYEIIDV